MKSGRYRRFAPLFLLALVTGWGASHGVAWATNRFKVPAPARTAKSAREQAAVVAAAGVDSRNLLTLVADGKSGGVTPDGNKVSLSIDTRLQQEVFELFRRFDPPFGAFAAVEPGTGRVVALVGYRRGGESDPSLALKAIYPAASLIKMITASAAIEKGGVDPDAEISYCGGIYTVSRQANHLPDGRGNCMTLAEAIAKSANVIFGKVTVNHVGAETLEQYLRKFGFGEKVPFDLAVEPSRFDVPREEFELARTGAGFGEVYVSPLHMATIMAGIGDNGAMPSPRLIDRIEDRHGAVTYSGTSEKWRDSVQPGTANTLMKMMVKTIEMGTSRRAFGTPERTPMLRDMEVAGKTGSLSGWTPRMNFEWFAGVAPVSGPKLALVALVVNDNRWKIKGNYVGKEAFSAYFGYPSSMPPSYAKAGGKRGGKVIHVSKKKGKHHKAVPARKRSKKARGAGKSPGHRTASAALPG
jgi:cell division protein FtsI/penicillin-binding protein 2